MANLILASLQPVLIQLFFFHSLLASCAINKSITPRPTHRHDLDHPGTTNSFQVNILAVLADRHNNKSVLENHHLNVLLSILRCDGADIFKALSRGERMSVINMMVDNVLETDIMRHFDFNTQITTKIESGSPFDPEKGEDRRLVAMTILKIADISNSSKSFDSALRWAADILEEFGRQGDLELAMGLPISSLCDRKTTDFDQSQVNFIKFIVSPFYKTCSDLIPFAGMESVYTRLNDNAQTWQARLDKTVAKKELDAANQESRQILLQELFLGQILFMSQDLTDAGVVDMCNSFMQSSSSVKMSQLGGDISEFLDVVHMACSCETVTLYWQNTYAPDIFEIVGSVGNGMPTQAIDMSKNGHSVTRGVFETGTVWNNNVIGDPVYNIKEDGRLTRNILCVPFKGAVCDGGIKTKDGSLVKGFIQMRNKIDESVAGRNFDGIVDFNDEDLSMTNFLIEQSAAKIQGKVDEKLMVDQIEHVLQHSDSGTNNAAATLEIVGVFMDKARMLIGADRCSLFLVDDIRGELCTAYASKDHRGDNSVRHGGQARTQSVGSLLTDDGEIDASGPRLVIRVPMGAGLVGACADSGKEIVIDDCQLDPRFNKASDKKHKYNTISCLCVPIKNSMGHVLGVVQMLNKQAQTVVAEGKDFAKVEVIPFAEDDVRKLRNIASKATTAIEKAQMYSKLDFIMDATNKINASSMDLDVLVARTMAAARKLLKADRCTLFLLDQGTNELYSHIIDHDDAEAKQGNEDQTNWSQLSKSQLDLGDNDEPYSRESGTSADRKSSTASKEDVIRSGSRRNSALELTTKRGEERRRSKRSQRGKNSQRGGKDIYKQPSKVYGRIAITHKDSAAIVFDSTKGIAGKALVTKESINCVDVYEDPKFNRSIDEQTGYRTKSVLCVPVMDSTGEVLGVAQMINKMQKKSGQAAESVSFSDQDEKLLRAFIAQVAVAMTNNQLFTQVFKTLSHNLSLFSTIPDVVLALKEDGSFIECNRPLKDVFNINPDNNVLQEHFSEWTENVPKEITAVLIDAFEHKVDVSVKFENPIVIGDYRYVEAHASPIIVKLKNRGVSLALKVDGEQKDQRHVCQTLVDEVATFGLGKMEEIAEPPEFETVDEEGDDKAPNSIKTIEKEDEDKQAGDEQAVEVAESTTWAVQSPGSRQTDAVKKNVMQSSGTGFSQNSRQDSRHDSAMDDDQNEQHPKNKSAISLEVEDMEDELA